MGADKKVNFVEEPENLLALSRSNHRSCLLPFRFLLVCLVAVVLSLVALWLDQGSLLDFAFFPTK